MQLSAHVLVADVVTATFGLDAIDETRDRLVAQTVRFRVVEAFKGTGTKQHEFEVRTDSNDVEATRFRIGSRYLVYASEREHGLWVTACSRTALMEPRSSFAREALNEELLELRACVAP
jgi:hypothetical protein